MVNRVRSCTSSANSVDDPVPSDAARGSFKTRGLRDAAACCSSIFADADRRTLQKPGDEASDRDCTT